MGWTNQLEDSSCCVGDICAPFFLFTRHSKSGTMIVILRFPWFQGAIGCFQEKLLHHGSMATFSDPNSVVNVSPFSTFFPNRFATKTRKLQRTEVQGLIPGTPKDNGTPFMVSRTHTIPIPFPYLAYRISLRGRTCRSCWSSLNNCWHPLWMVNRVRLKLRQTWLRYLGVGLKPWRFPWGDQQKTQKISAWKLKMMGLGSDDFPQFHVPVNVQLYSKSSFFGRSKGPTERTPRMSLTFHGWLENFRLDVRKRGLWKNTLWFLSQSFNGRSACLQPTTRSKQIAIRFPVSLISGKSIVHRMTWNVGVSWCISWFKAFKYFRNIIRNIRKFQEKLYF